MIQVKTHTTEVQKQTAPARQLEQEATRQPEQVQLVAPQTAYRRAQVNRSGLRPADLLALQRTVGNRRVQQMVVRRINTVNDSQHRILADENSSIGVQTNLTPGVADNTYKQKVNSIAAQVMRTQSHSARMPLIQLARRGPEQRQATVRVRWSDDNGEFYRRLVTATAKSQGFRGVLESDLWQPFYDPAFDFHKHYLHLHPLDVNNEDIVTVQVSAWYDPDVFPLPISSVGVFISETSPTRVSKQGEAKKETRTATTTEPPSIDVATAKLDYPQILTRVKQTAAAIQTIALRNYKQAIDNLDIGALATSAAVLERLLLALDVVKENIQSRRNYELGISEIIEELDQVYKALKAPIYNTVSLFWYKGSSVLEAVPKGEPASLVVHVREETPKVLQVIDDAAKMISVLKETKLAYKQILEAYNLFQLHKSRPINVFFKKFALSKEGLWDRFQGYSHITGFALTGIVSKAKSDSAIFGILVDTGEFDIDTAIKLLSYGVLDWAITDKEAQKLFNMIASARPDGRETIIKLLNQKGYLSRLCENLPWLAVKNLHDSIKDPKARELLQPYFKGKGGGKSMQKLYEESIIDHVHKENYVRAFLLTWLQTAHEGLTFGAMSTISEAYDLREQGLISDDEFWSTVGKASGRTGIVLGATILTGGVAGGFTEGMAGSLGAGETAATLIGGTVGGAVAGVSGQFTADIYNIAAFDQEGLSSADAYLKAAGLGGATGLVLAGVSITGNKLLPGAAQATAKLYAEKYPRLTKLYDISRVAGEKFGQSLKPQQPQTETGTLLGPKGTQQFQIKGYKGPISKEQARLAAILESNPEAKAAGGLQGAGLTPEEVAQLARHVQANKQAATFIAEKGIPALEALLKAQGNPRLAMKFYYEAKAAAFRASQKIPWPERNVAFGELQIRMPRYMKDIEYPPAVSGEALEGTLKGTGDYGAFTKPIRGRPGMHGGSRRFDSEVKIFENAKRDLQVAKEKSGNSKLKGKLRVYTERERCPSCEDLTNKFKLDHPGIEVEIIFTYPNSFNSNLPVLYNPG